MSTGFANLNSIFINDAFLIFFDSFYEEDFLFSGLISKFMILILLFFTAKFKFLQKIIFYIIFSFNIVIKKNIEHN